MNSHICNRNKATIFIFAYLAPCSIIFILFVVVPFIQGIPVSFMKWDGFSESMEYIGLQNYIRLFQDIRLSQPVLNTLYFTFVYVLLSNFFGLLLALALKMSNWFNNILRTIFFVPFVLSMILAAFIFSYIYSDVFYGIFGIKSFLGNPETVNTAIAVIAIWKDSGYCMVIYVAALNLVPDTYYEAARIEGCGPIRSFFAITVPMIVPAFTSNITLLMTWGLQAFDYQMAATGGGPGHASETVGIFIYKNIFVYHKAGYGQAAGILLTVALAAVTLFITSMLRRKEVEI